MVSDHDERAGLRASAADEARCSLGCEPEVIGRVVAQHAPAGAELARNVIVTLYVAAPGAIPDDWLSATGR
jgi:hypothetical protein